MAIGGLTFTVEDKNTTRRLGVAISRFHDEIVQWGPLWDDVQRTLQRNERRQFASEGSQAGNPWAALSPDYARRKRLRWGNRKILQASGAMRKAMSNEGDPNALRIKTRDQFAYGTKGVGYASYHQTGTPNMPQRRVVDWPESLVRELAQDLRRHNNRVARRVGLRYEDTPGDVRGDLLPDEVT